MVKGLCFLGTSVTPSLPSISEILKPNAIMLPSEGQLNDDADIVVARIAIFTIIGIVVFVFVVLCLILCCCRSGCRSERRGYIVINRETDVISPPVDIPIPVQPAVVQHIPPAYTQETIQQFPPQYQSPLSSPTQYSSVQQQGYQYSPMHSPTLYSAGQPQTHYTPVLPGYQDDSTLEFFNPREPPPPYEFIDPNSHHQLYPS